MQLSSSSETVPMCDSFQPPSSDPELARSYFPQTETNRLLDQLASEVRALQREMRDLKMAVPPSSGALAVTDVDQLIEYMDERFRQITGNRSDRQDTED